MTLYCNTSMIWGRYRGGRQPPSDDSFHSPTVTPPSALDKPSIVKRYRRRWTTRWGVIARSPTMVTLHDTKFVECRWWNDGWTAKTVVTWLPPWCRPLVVMARALSMGWPRLLLGVCRLHDQGRSGDEWRTSSPAPACSRRVWSSGECWQATRLLL